MVLTISHPYVLSLQESEVNISYCPSGLKISGVVGCHFKPRRRLKLEWSTDIVTSYGISSHTPTRLVFIQLWRKEAHIISEEMDLWAIHQF